MFSGTDFWVLPSIGYTDGDDMRHDGNRPESIRRTWARVYTFLLGLVSSLINVINI